LKRTGDTSEQVSVKCETIDGSAKASQDFIARHNRVTFEPGQTTAFCNVTIVDNDEFEVQESFHLRLHHPLQRALINQTSDRFCILINEDTRDSKFTLLSNSIGALVSHRTSGVFQSKRIS